MKKRKILLVIALVLASALLLVCCGEKEPEKCEHTYEEAITTEASCTVAGLKTFTCSQCGDSYTEEIAALGHNYVKGVAVPPTCEEDGYTPYACACGDNYKEDIVPADGHLYQTVVVAPTCTEGGYTMYTCLCGHTYSDSETPASGEHTYAVGIAALTEEEKAAYPTAVGIRAECCTKCGLRREGETGELILLNLDFEGEYASTGKYITGFDMLCTYKTNTNCGRTADGIWSNSEKRPQWCIGENMHLENYETFTISYDFILASDPDDKGYLFGWGSGTADAASTYRFNIRVNSEGKILLYKNFNLSTAQSAKMTGYTLTERDTVWYHMDVVVNTVGAELTIYAGKWTDETRTAMEDYTLVGKTAGFDFKVVVPEDRQSMFRLTSGNGALAIDNFVISIPAAE